MQWYGMIQRDPVRPFMQFLPMVTSCQTITTRMLTWIQEGQSPLHHHKEPFGCSFIATPTSYSPTPYLAPANH